MTVKDGGDKRGGEVASGPSLKGDLAALVKLRLNVFVLLTTFFGFLIAVLSQSGAWEWGQLWALVHTLVGTAAAAFGSAVFNQLMEIKEDARMLRTADRPLAAPRAVRLREAARR